MEHLPSLSIVAQSLRKTTERVAHELAASDCAPPSWTEFDWNIARAVSAMQGVTPLLHLRLAWQGPDRWQDFLQQQYQQSMGRHAHIVGLLDTIDSQARRAGIALLALKGAALYAKQIYLAGERPMGDIDLLIRPRDATATAKVLELCGYSPAFDTKRHQVFQPRMRKTVRPGLGEHVDNPIKIELHTSVAEPLPVTLNDITTSLFPANCEPGINGYASDSALMRHLLLHAAGNIRARALRLIQLHDIALLAKRFKEEDWDLLGADDLRGGTHWWGYGPLLLTARYFPIAIPAPLLERLARDCPSWLRWHSRRQQLTDVSWSNIRVQAFPGLEWSRNPVEALAFMRSRIWPSREARLELKEGAAQIPDSASIPWYGISHASRILRWLFSHPPRVQTMLSVRAALSGDGC
jgi:Uncharacterised nucleotidyltransferase